MEKYLKLNIIGLIVLITTNIILIKSVNRANEKECVHECIQETPIVNINIDNTEVEKPIKKKEVSEISTTKKESKSDEFIITAYDNSVESQGAWVNQTATEYNLKGKTREEAMCLAVDPKIIPLNSKVKLTFDSDYAHMNGIYIARDTGGAIKGNRLDLFMGDGVNPQIVRNFGKRKVQVEIIKG